jgi:succinate dehydrogenase/fumarate reductase-like Fe-S protein
MQKDNKKELLCDVQDLEQHWNKTVSPTNNNVRVRYLNNPSEHKQRQVKIMDMGTFCIINDITPDMLRMGVRHIKEVASLFSDQKFEEKNKIVIMSEEDYKEYEQFKNFKMINEKMSKK